MNWPIALHHLLNDKKKCYCFVGYLFVCFCVCILFLFCFVLFRFVCCFAFRLFVSLFRLLGTAGTSKTEEIGVLNLTLLTWGEKAIGMHSDVLEVVIRLWLFLSIDISKWLHYIYNNKKGHFWKESLKISNFLLYIQRQWGTLIIIDNTFLKMSTFCLFTSCTFKMIAE